MTKSISLNAKINKITKADEIKSECRNAADVRVKEIVTLINMIVNNKEDEWKNDAINDVWEKWARKTNMRRRYVNLIFIDIVLFVESQYIKISKQI